MNKCPSLLQPRRGEGGEKIVTERERRTPWIPLAHNENPPRALSIIPTRGESVGTMVLEVERLINISFSIPHPYRHTSKDGNRERLSLQQEKCVESQMSAWGETWGGEKLPECIIMVTIGVVRNSRALNNSAELESWRA